MNRNPCSPSDDPPRPSRSIPPAQSFLFLSIAALSAKAARDFQISAVQQEQSNHCLHDRVFVVTVVIVAADPHRGEMMMMVIMQTPKFERGIFSHGALAQRENPPLWRSLLGDDKRRDSESSDENDARQQYPAFCVISRGHAVVARSPRDAACRK